jgi:hypothetical protein
MRNGDVPFCIKRGSAYMLLQTQNLAFIDLLNYLGMGCTYDAFLRAYLGSNDQANLKLHWPHEWFASMTLLEQTFLPPKSTFNSTLKNTIFSDEQYMQVQEIWKTRNMKCMKDLLRAYSENDTVPFVLAVEKLRQYWSARNVCMLKSACSLPGLANKLMFQTTSKHALFVLEPKGQSDLYFEIKEQLTGGPAIVFSR